MCGSFSFTRNALIGLNIMYMVVAFLLIGVATYGKTASVITSVSILGGIVACGVFLLFIAILGLVGAVKHHQVSLFFYMVVLFLLFIIQFSVACACLAVKGPQRRQLAEFGWRHASNDTKRDAQNHFGCCGFDTTQFNASNPMTDHPACPAVCCPGTTPEECCLVGPACIGCTSCANLITDSMESGLNAGGGIGLFFSFTEIVGFALALWYRRQADPDRVQVLE
ncbi:tetraspanin-13-like isoform X2 [Amphibalanus amphitrite]|uniref:tetraspanin-13-like isoform X2 n=1 Tax=Amphibalanus amphitrite TaxID=1232801 RepID=UPI001C91BCD3|nr:tetraspanin-13-like isoform X2 [Amphibalanus amphitrite]